MILFTSESFRGLCCCKVKKIFIVTFTQYSVIFFGTLYCLWLNLITSTSRYINTPVKKYREEIHFRIHVNINSSLCFCINFYCAICDLFCQLFLMLFSSTNNPRIYKNYSGCVCCGCRPNFLSYTGQGILSISIIIFDPVEWDEEPSL